MKKLIKKSINAVKLLLILIGFVVSLSVTSTAQTSTESSTKPTDSDKTVTISQADADRCANNTRELIAAREEIRAYRAEISARDNRDKYAEKLIATYDRAIELLDKVIAAQDSLSADKDNLIKAQNELIKTLRAQSKNKSSPLKAIINVLAGVFLGKVLK